MVLASFYPLLFHLCNPLFFLHSSSLGAERAALPVWEGKKLNPLAFWTFEDCWSYLRKHKVLSCFIGWMNDWFVVCFSSYRSSSIIWHEWWCTSKLSLSVCLHPFRFLITLFTMLASLPWVICILPRKLSPRFGSHMVVNDLDVSR